MQDENDFVQRACRLGDLCLLDEALQNAPHLLNEADAQMGWTPLYRAVICRHPSLVQFLLQKGANPNISTKVGEYPLHQAADTNQVDIAEVLLQQYADPNVQQNCELYADGETALHIAASKGFVELIHLLLKYKASLSIKDFVYGQTPLHFSIKANSLQAAEVLMQLGASLTVQDAVPLTQSDKAPGMYCQSLEMTTIVNKYAEQTNRSTFFSQTDDLSLSRSASGLSVQDFGLEQRLTRIDDLSRRMKDTVTAPAHTAPEREPSEYPETQSPVKETPTAMGPNLEVEESRQKLFNWLTNLKLETCYKELLEAGYDDLDQMIAQMQSALPISQDFLERIGIKKLGHRLRLLAALEMESGSIRKKKRRTESLGQCISPTQPILHSFPFPSLRDWLAEMQLDALAPDLAAAGFEDLELLLVQMNTSFPLTDPALEDAGVKSASQRTKILERLRRDSVGVEQYRKYIPLAAGIEMEREGRHVTCQSCQVM